MTRSINDVDLGASICYGSILGEDSDSSFTLDVIGIHDTFLHFLILTEDAGLFQQLVYKCCFTVVNVGDDSHISDIISCYLHNFHSFFQI